MTTPVSPRWSHPALTTTLTTADGQSIHATMRGSGTTAVVVVHGFSGGHKHGSFSKILGWLEGQYMVIAIDLRGHHSSSGFCTMGHLEVLDVDAAVGWARSLGAEQVFTLGFSLGSACVLRQAALSNPTLVRPEFDRALVVKHQPDGVISMGGTSQWFYRGTLRMAAMHFALSFKLGREFVKNKMGVRVDLSTWPDEHHPRRREIQPLDPRDCIAQLAPMPVLIVQGEHDNYFPVHHGEALFEAAQVDSHRAEYWFEPETGHAESAITFELATRMKSWIAHHIRSSR